MKLLGVLMDGMSEITNTLGIGGASKLIGGFKQLPESAKEIAELAALRTHAEKFEKAGMSKSSANSRAFYELLKEKEMIPSAGPTEGVQVTRGILPAKLPNVWPEHLKEGEQARAIKKLIPGRIANPAYQAEHVFGAEASPALDAAEAFGHVAGNTSWWTKHLTPHLKGYKNPEKLKDSKGVTFAEDMAAGVRKAWPLENELTKLYAQQQRLQTGIKNLETRSKARRFTAAAKTKFAAGAEQAKTKLGELEAQIAQTQEKLTELNRPLMMKWAGHKEAGPAVRIMLALEDDMYPWVTGMMSKKELAARDAIRRTLDVVQKRATELGLPVVTTRKYAPHYTGELLRTMRKSDPYIIQNAHIFNLPKDLRWQHRSTGSMQWWPNPFRMPHYYADASRRLSFTPVLQKWEPVFSNLEKRGMTAEADFFRKWMQDMAYGEGFQGKAGKYLDAIVEAEYFDKIAMSLGTGFKHAMKALKGFAFHPVAFSRGAAQTLSSAAVRRFAPGLRKAGIAEENMADAARYYLQGRAVFRGFSGIETDSKFAKYLSNSVVAFPTSMVEAFERSSILAGMMLKGAGAQTSINQTMRSMWHAYMSDVSYMGQVDRYRWLQSPLQRLFFLFYYTPARVLEQSLKTMIYSVLPETVMQQTKEGILKTAWQMRRSPDGTTYAGKALRAAMVIGGAEALARSYDTSIWQVASFHVPFLRHNQRGEYEFAAPMPLDLMNRVNQMGLSRDAFLAALLDHFSFNTPRTISNILKGPEFIPEIYKGGPVNPNVLYWLKLPSVSAQQRIKEETDPRTMKKRQQMIERIYTKEHGWKAVLEAFRRFASWGAASITPADDAQEPSGWSDQSED